MYIVKNKRGKILQASIALAKCITLAKGFGPRSFTLVSTSKSSLTLRVVLSCVETTTASGLIIPDNAKEKPQKGLIVAVGNGKKDEPITVKVGDSVLYGKYSGTEITIDGKDYLIMRESDIFAVL